MPLPPFPESTLNYALVFAGGRVNQAKRAGKDRAVSSPNI